jgi:hypothetical protein
MHKSPSRPTARRAAATLGLLTVLGAGFAPVAHADEEPPGNKGTVKVHETGTPDDDRREEPKLCDFRIVGFGFPEDAELAVHIDGHGGPNAGPDTFDATVTSAQLSDAGDWAIDGPTLADGMYKLYVENTTAPGGAKQKVFKIDCPEVSGSPATVDTSDAGAGGETSVLGASVTGGTAAAMEVGGNEAASAPETFVLGATIERASALPTVAAASQGSTEVAGTQVSRGALARTGSEVLSAVLLATGLLGIGAVLLRARRHLTSA